MFMSARVYDKRKSYKVDSARKDVGCEMCHGSNAGARMSQRPKKTLAATVARKSQGNSNKSATTFQYNTVATFFYACPGHGPWATDPNPFPSVPSPDYPKLSLSRTSLCLSLDRHVITYAGNISQGNKSANSCHKTNNKEWEKQKGEKFSSLFFYCERVIWYFIWSGFNSPND